MANFDSEIGHFDSDIEARTGLAGIGANGIELAACNLYFAFPLSVQVSARQRWARGSVASQTVKFADICD
jgi:hypothetical protein